DLTKRFRNGARMRVEVKHFHFKTTREMNLPYTRQRQLIEEFRKRLATIHTVAVHVVQIQQQAAISCFDYARDELAVRHLISSRPQITDTGFDRERNL